MPFLGKEAFLIYFVVAAVVICLVAYASTAIINIFEGFSLAAMEFTVFVLIALIFFAVMIGYAFRKPKLKEQQQTICDC